jgi:hypothetical protein
VEDQATALRRVVEAGIWFGALVGALARVIPYGPERGRRDFGSIRGMRADRYELLVDDEARRLVGTTEAPAEHDFG